MFTTYTNKYYPLYVVLWGIPEPPELLGLGPLLDNPGSATAARRL